ncbi:hypothetical protein QQZ08_010291 [Neonectria magnoliae]|uniref:Apple domain-containing protein n=1 Tax=Neonectria magnoliae TaxID=2732573 RepID=A0ABR1HII0_9HYPO
MTRTRLIIAIVAALAVPGIDAGPCKASSSSALSTETSTTISSQTTTSATATTTAGPDCTLFDPKPAQAICGQLGFPPGNIIASREDVELDECAEACQQTTDCLTFSFSGGNCILYTDSGLKMRNLPRTVGPPWYEMECWDCDGTPTTTASVTTATSTSSSITTIVPP